MPLNAAQGALLLCLAKDTIKKYLGLKVSPVELKNKTLKQKSGIFVTLHKNNQLRGCIGSLTAQQTIIDGVRNHAINAAFADQRFPPVSEDELPDIRIEISILSTPTTLPFIDAEDLQRKLRPHHGVTLYSGQHQATFLPQVWQQLPKPEDFLNHLAHKAGLEPNSWRQPGIRIETYQVTTFSENN